MITIKTESVVTIIISIFNNCLQTSPNLSMLSKSIVAYKDEKDMASTRKNKITLPKKKDWQSEWESSSQITLHKISTCQIKSRGRHK